MKFRKKPVVIEAIQFDSNTDESELLAFLEGNQWQMDTEVRGHTLTTPDGFDYPCLRIKTLEGTMTASVGDWSIKGVKGEYYPCKPDIFAATYEAVE